MAHIQTRKLIKFKCNSCKTMFHRKSDFKHHKCMTEDLLAKLDELKHKKGLFRVICKSNELEWTITAALFPQYITSKNKTSEKEVCKNIDVYKPFYERLNFPNLANFAIEKAVEVICDHCKINLNIFLYENGRIYPYIIPQSSHKQFCDILLVQVQNEKAFLVIKKLVSIHPKIFGNRYICRRCLQMCSTKSSYNNHLQLCLQFKIQKVTMGMTKTLKFRNIRKQVDAPFVVFCDFETILAPESSNLKNKINKHIPIAVCYKMTSYIKGQTRPSVSYVGLDCVTFFNKFIDFFS